MIKHNIVFYSLVKTQILSKLNSNGYEKGRFYEWKSSICTISKAILCISGVFAGLQKEKTTIYLLNLKMKIKLLMVGQVCVSFVKKNVIRNVGMVMSKSKLFILVALLVGTICVSGCSGSVTTTGSSSNSITESSVVESSMAESSMAESSILESSVEESSEDSYYVQEVTYISNRSVQYTEAQDMYNVMFSFLDQNNEPMKTSGTAKISIKDNKDNILYEKSIDFDESDFTEWTNQVRDDSTLGCWLNIPKNDVKGGASYRGKMTLEVTGTDMHFDPFDMDMSNLPEKQVEIKLPETPVTHTDRSYSRVISYVTIHSLTYKQTYLSSDGEASVEFEALISLDDKTGEDNISSSAEVGYKVYDEDDIVVTSGDIYTNNLAIGEKSKKTFTVNHLDPMKIYTLKLFDSV